MAKASIKGHEINIVSIRDSYSRKAQQFKNNIIQTLGKIGLTDDDIDIPLDPVASKKIPAHASWYMDGRHLHYSYSAASKFVENMYAVFKVIEAEVNLLQNGKKSLEEFISEFSEDTDIKKLRAEARETLGVAHDSIDLNEINSKYKALAKEAHPDMPTGSVEAFKKINNAHKILKRELS